MSQEENATASNNTRNMGHHAVLYYESIVSMRGTVT